MSDRLLREYAPAVLLGCGLVLGGSSSGGIWANAALQVLSAAVLGWLVVYRGAALLPRSLAWLAGAIVALPALQLLPLPPAVWTALPGRTELAGLFAQTGYELPWLPVTLDRDATLAVLTGLLPPLAALALMAQASPRGQRRALVAVVAIASGSVLLGAAQQIAGEGTALQPYQLTNPGMATGLFANRNHLAALLSVAMPCAALVVLPGRRLAKLGILTGLLGGVLLTGSQAGLLLGLIAAVASLFWIGEPLFRPRVMVPLLAVLAIAGGLAGMWLIEARTGLPDGVAQQHRPAMIATTLAAARDQFPLGSGGGTFLRVYQHYENPNETDLFYRNHAHSDFAEILLEYGAAGLLVMLAALIWLARHGLAAWRGGEELAGARAGALILVLLLTHSLVDYPLRTAGLAMLAGLAAVLLAQCAGAAPATPHRRRKHLRVEL